VNGEKSLTHRLAVIVTMTSVAVSSCIGLMTVAFIADPRILPRIVAFALAATAAVAQTRMLFYATEAIQSTMEAERQRGSD
jgi:hypothetical protein